ncbi:MAG: tetratricopeptide repeat protein, partial [Polyangiales bacterium]
PPLIHTEVQIEKATLTTLLATAALAAFVKGTRRSLTLAGLLTGAAVLGRGNLLFAIPAGALALALERRDEAEPTVRVAGRDLSRVSLGRAGRFTLAASAVVGLLTLRNVVVGHELLLTTSIGGPSLYAAQLRTNSSATYNPPPFVRPASEFEHDDFHAEAERRTGHRMTDSEVNSYFAREALSEMFWAPGATIERSLRKLRLAFHDYEVSDNDDVYLTAAFSPVLNLPLFWVGQVAPFALLGAIVSWRRARAARATAGAVAVYAATLVLFYVMGRLRLPMAPALIALGATGAAWLFERIYARDARRGLTGAAIVLVAALPCLTWSSWIDDMRSSTLAVACNNIAAQLQRAGRTAEAIAMYERAIDTRPAMVIGAMRTLGDLYLTERRYDDAERVMRLVLSHKRAAPSASRRSCASTRPWRPIPPPGDCPPYGRASRRRIAPSAATPRPHRFRAARPPRPPRPRRRPRHRRHPRRPRRPSKRLRERRWCRRSPRRRTVRPCGSRRRPTTRGRSRAPRSSRRSFAARDGTYAPSGARRCGCVRGSFSSRPTTRPRRTSTSRDAPRRPRTSSPRSPAATARSTTSACVWTLNSRAFRSLRISRGCSSWGASPERRGVQNPLVNPATYDAPLLSSGSGPSIVTLATR